MLTPEQKHRNRVERIVQKQPRLAAPVIHQRKETSDGDGDS